MSYFIIKANTSSKYKPITEGPARSLSSFLKLTSTCCLSKWDTQGQCYEGTDDIDTARTVGKAGCEEVSLHSDSIMQGSSIQ